METQIVFRCKFKISKITLQTHFMYIIKSLSIFIKEQSIIEIMNKRTLIANAFAATDFAAKCEKVTMQYIFCTITDVIHRHTVIKIIVKCSTLINICSLFTATSVSDMNQRKQLQYILLMEQKTGQRQQSLCRHHNNNSFCEGGCQIYFIFTKCYLRETIDDFLNQKQFQLYKCSNRAIFTCKPQGIDSRK